MQLMRNISTMASGTIISQLVASVGSIFLARIYGPNAFGDFAMVLAVATIISSFAFLRYEHTINLPRSDRQAKEIFVLCLVILTVLSVLCWLVLFWGESLLIGRPLHGDSYFFGLLVVSAAFVISLLRLVSSLLQRKKIFVGLATVKVVNSFFTLGGQITFSIFAVAGFSLTLGYTAGSAIAIIVAVIFLMRRSQLMSGLRFPSRQRALRLLFRYRKFPIWNLPGGILNSIGSQGPVLVFGLIYSSTNVGLYALALRVLNVPMAVVATSVAQVFLPTGVRLNRLGDLSEVTSRVFSGLSAFILPPLFFVFLTGDELFGFVFGNEWVDSGIVAKYMVFWIYFNFCSSPLMVLLIKERNKESLFLQFFLLFLRVAALVIAFLFLDNNFHAGVLLFAIASAIGYFVFLVVKLVVARCDLSKAVAKVAKQLFINCFLVVPLVLYLKLSYEYGFVFIVFYGGFVAAYYLNVIRGMRLE